MSRFATRVSTGSAEVVSEMRSLARAADTTVDLREDVPDERQACVRVTTTLMLLLVLVLFVTSALADLIPRISTIVQASL